MPGSRLATWGSGPIALEVRQASLGRIRWLTALAPARLDVRSSRQYECYKVQTARDAFVKTRLLVATTEFYFPSMNEHGAIVGHTWDRQAVLRIGQHQDAGPILPTHYLVGLHADEWIGAQPFDLFVRPLKIRRDGRVRTRSRWKRRRAGSSSHIQSAESQPL